MGDVKLPEIGLAALALAALFVATMSWALPRGKGVKAGWVSTLAAFLLLTFAITLRWIGVGHPPVFGTFENGLAAAWIITLLALIFRQWLSEWPPAPAAVALLSLGYGLLFETGRIPLTISERSIWVDIHALLAWLAYGFFALSAIAATRYLLKVRKQEGQGARGKPGNSDCGMRNAEYDGFNESARKQQLRPQSSVLSPPNADLKIWDELQNRWISLGFLYQTALMVTGAYYSSLIFGHWWRWDLVESVSLVSWLIYALAVHLRLFRGWKGVIAARLNLFAFAMAILPYWFLIFFPRLTYHIFDIGMKLEH